MKIELYSARRLKQLVLTLGLIGVLSGASMYWSQVVYPNHSAKSSNAIANGTKEDLSSIRVINETNDFIDGVLLILGIIGVLIIFRKEIQSVLNLIEEKTSTK